MTNDNPTVAVVGLGYIGLPTAAIIARSGCQVIGVDTSPNVVDTSNRGDIHIEEVDLDGLARRVRRAARGARDRLHGALRRGAARARRRCRCRAAPSCRSV